MSADKPKANDGHGDSVPGDDEQKHADFVGKSIEHAKNNLGPQVGCYFGAIMGPTAYRSEEDKRAELEYWEEQMKDFGKCIPLPEENGTVSDDNEKQNDKGGDEE